MLDGGRHSQVVCPLEESSELPLKVVGYDGAAPQYLAAYKKSVVLRTIEGIGPDNYDNQGNVVTFIAEISAVRFTLMVENKEVTCRLERGPLFPKTICEPPRGGL
jgi:hypothetical protein